jgi:two-component sensor histidine kinase
LLREVNHRTKNMLGVVQAIARSTAASNPEEFQARFADRIRALASAHDLLVHSDWQGVELAELIKAEIGNFGDLVGARVTLDGPPLRISGSAAQTLGMALHELVSNAVVYGALSQAEGNVTVAWRRENESFTIDWIERDGPALKPAERRGFGTVVLERMTRMALGGEVELKRSAEGLSWHLRCPIGKIEAKPFHLD